MTILAFPSEEFPAPPAITLQIPDGWRPVHSPGTVMAAHLPQAKGTFVPNVVVRVDRRPADFELTEALEELRQYAAKRPDGRTSEPFSADLDGHLFIGCDVSWVDEQAGTVLQAHLFGSVSSGSSQQVVQVTGSVGGARAREDYPMVKAVMKTLSVVEPKLGGGR